MEEGRNSGPDEPRTDSMSKTQAEKQRKLRQKATVQKGHVDIIQDAFWEANSYLLSDS